MPVVKQSLLLTAEFESISSLRPGSDVYYYGMEVGSVQNIYLNPDNNHIMVDFDVRKGIKVPHNAEAVAYVPSILYSARLELRFQASEQDEYLESGDIISGTVGSYLFDLRDQAAPYIKKLDSLVLSIFPTKDSVRQVIKSIELTIRQFHRGTGNFKNSLNSNKAYLSSLLANLDKISADLDKKEALINSSLSRLTKSTEDFKKNDFAKTLSKLNADNIKMPDLKSVNKLIGGISTEIENINTGKDSSLSWLFSDVQAKNKIKGNIEKAKNMANDLRLHPEEYVNIKKKK